MNWDLVPDVVLISGGEIYYRNQDNHEGYNDANNGDNYDNYRYNICRVSNTHSFSGCDPSGSSSLGCGSLGCGSSSFGCNRW